jgi:hypothetical protein
MCAGQAGPRDTISSNLILQRNSCTLKLIASTIIIIIMLLTTIASSTRKCQSSSLKFSNTRFYSSSGDLKTRSKLLTGDPADPQSWLKRQAARSQVRA